MGAFESLHSNTIRFCLSTTARSSSKSTEKVNPFGKELCTLQHREICHQSLALEDLDGT